MLLSDKLDWSSAESSAIGTLLTEGFSVSGYQDKTLEEEHLVKDMLFLEIKKITTDTFQLIIFKRIK